MTATGLRTFDSTLQKVNVWIADIMKELEWDDRKQAYRALRAVLHTLRDHLPLNESVQLAAQLPQLIRGLYYEGWKPNHVPHVIRHWDDFTASVSEAFQDPLVASPAKITQTVLNVLAKHVSPGEIEDVKRCLPEDIRRHWRIA